MGLEYIGVYIAAPLLMEIAVRSLETHTVAMPKLLSQGPRLELV